MFLMRKNVLHLLLCICGGMALCSPTPLMAKNSRFTVVIDAGHGGRDPGAVGAISKEKDINLAVALEVGRIIEREHKEVKVVYTRKTDAYLTLQERANIVNKHSADLFICIHANSVKNSKVYGAETFTLGLDKIQSNLDVAMAENSVILLEENYESTYHGFNPNSVESYIMFEFMQDQYINQSLQFASKVQHHFTSTYKRYDRGVRQAPFFVLHKSACPSVLVELGFISNREEERYLASKKGQQEMAGAIGKAFAEYKKEIDSKSQITLAGAEAAAATEPPVTTTNRVLYRVQIFSINTKLPANDAAFKGLTNTWYFQENGYYKYTYGEETELKKIQEVRRAVVSKFKDAFIVAFHNGKRISLKEAEQIIRQNK